jgi:hypothetical protein
MSANGSGEIGGGTGGVKGAVANFRDARPKFAGLVYRDGGKASGGSSASPASKERVWATSGAFGATSGAVVL